MSLPITYTALSICIPIALIKSSVHITNLLTLESQGFAEVEAGMLSNMVISGCSKVTGKRCNRSIDFQ